MYLILYIRVPLNGMANAYNRMVYPNGYENLTIDHFYTLSGTLFKHDTFVLFNSRVFRDSPLATVGNK